MSYEVFKKPRREARKDEDCKNVYIARSKISGGNFFICKRSKNRFFGCTPETTLPEICCKFKMTFSFSKEDFRGLE